MLEFALLDIKAVDIIGITGFIVMVGSVWKFGLYTVKTGITLMKYVLQENYVQSEYLWKEDCRFTPVNQDLSKRRELYIDLSSCRKKPQLIIKKK